MTFPFLSVFLSLEINIRAALNKFRKKEKNLRKSKHPNFFSLTLCLWLREHTYCRHHTVHYLLLKVHLDPIYGWKNYENTEIYLIARRQLSIFCFCFWFSCCGLPMLRRVGNFTSFLKLHKNTEEIFTSHLAMCSGSVSLWSRLQHPPAQRLGAKSTGSLRKPSFLPWAQS